MRNPREPGFIGVQGHPRYRYGHHRHQQSEQTVLVQVRRVCLCSEAAFHLGMSFLQAQGCWEAKSDDRGGVHHEPGAWGCCYSVRAHS